LLRHRGNGALAEEADALSMSKFFSLDMTDTSAACICCVSQLSTTKIQDAVRRLNKKNADVRILLALFGTEAAMPSIAAVGATVAGASFGTVAEAIVQATSEQRNDATGNTKDIIAT